ncbi:MAG TPA: copper homeostasis membrane protein CopD [Caldimonas sp.]|jgi:putative copper resistance protein D
MEATFVIVRAVHLGALVALTGGLVFAISIAGADRSPGDTIVGRDRSATWKRSSALWLALAMASGLAWLGLEAASMSGQPLAQALGRQTLGTVIAETDFGNVWLVRGALSLGLAALLAVASRSSPTAARSVLLLCTIVAAALLSSLALVGHANAEHGTQRGIHLVADAVHLLAAGAWLGALVPLAALLRRQSTAGAGAPLDDVADAVRRFSSLGLLAVGTLLLTGVVNASFTVATIPALLTTRYGHLLLCKLALFGGMLALAANNRTRLTPSLADAALAPSTRAVVVARLGRNAMAEIALGLAVLAVVGVLGATMPASHASAMAPAMRMP